MFREIELQPNCLTLKQLEQGIQRQTVFAQEVHNFSEYRFTDEHRSLHLFHKRDSPLVMGIVAIEIGEQRTSVTYRDHGRRNLLRAFVPGTRLPARVPAKSALIA